MLLWQLAGVVVGDLIVAVGDVDVKWSRHDQVVAMIRDTGPSVRLSLVTPVDRNFIDPDTVSGCGRDDPGSVGVQPDSQVHSALDVSHERQPGVDTCTPTLARYWGFRRKRNKNS